MSLHGSYTDNLELAKEFEDFASDILWREWHWPIRVYSSAKWQIGKGENLSGVEIKLDQRFRETGNLFIEYSERSDVCYSFKDSGINGKGHMCLIGDEEGFWLFGFSTLKNMDKRYHFPHVEISTAKGFLVPLAIANEWAIRTYGDCCEDGIPFE